MSNKVICENMQEIAKEANRPTTTETFYMIADKKQFCDSMYGFAIYDNTMERHTHDGVCYSNEAPKEITGFASIGQATAMSDYGNAEKARRALSGKGNDRHELAVVEVKATYACRIVLDVDELTRKGIAV